MSWRLCAIPVRQINAIQYWHPGRSNLLTFSGIFDSLWLHPIRTFNTTRSASTEYTQIPPRSTFRRRCNQSSKFFSNHMQMSTMDTSSSSTTQTPEDVIRFWFPDPSTQLQANYELWYKTNPSTDDQIRAQFGSVVESALSGSLSDPINPNAWITTPNGALALTIVLDQFTRNVFRGSAKAFGGDVVSKHVVRYAIENKFDVDSYGVFGKVFGILLPLMHSEDTKDHELFQVKVAEYKAMLEKDGVDGGFKEAAMKIFVDVENYEEQHVEIVNRFGRYPYRNAVFGRATTKEEEEWLASVPKEKRFGQ